ncbi:MAG TPA: response regulator [Cytophagaceae bacterium]|nr:response regulator [Cytophagaceae bacterium]
MENTEIEIVLVEDNPHDAEMTIRALTKNKVLNKIVHLEDGAEALDFIYGTGKYTGRNTAIKPKVILLDVKMPKVNGIEVLRKIKSDDRTKTIPVVMLTSSKEDPDVRTCYELGANSYIVKPVDFENFTKSIAELGVYWLLLNEPLK